jgi:hypothetical protein
MIEGGPSINVTIGEENASKEENPVSQENDKAVDSSFVNHR